jgi:hypothetical protein
VHCTEASVTQIVGLEPSAVGVQRLFSYIKVPAVTVQPDTDLEQCADLHFHGSAGIFCSLV